MCVLAFVAANIHTHALNETITLAGYLFLFFSFFLSFSLVFNGCKWHKAIAIVGVYWKWFVFFRSFSLSLYLRCNANEYWCLCGVHLNEIELLQIHKTEMMKILFAFVTFSTSFNMAPLDLDTMEAVSLFGWKYSGILLEFDTMIIALCICPYSLIAIIT